MTYEGNNATQYSICHMIRPPPPHPSAPSSPPPAYVRIVSLDLQITPCSPPIPADPSQTEPLHSPSIAAANHQPEPRCCSCVLQLHAVLLPVQFSCSTAPTPLLLDDAVTTVLILIQYHCTTATTAIKINIYITNTAPTPQFIQLSTT